MINNEPCIVGGYWDPLSIECLNTETMRWYFNEATPKRRRTAHASIVHDGILYVCPQGYYDENCLLCNITGGSHSLIPFSHLYHNKRVRLFVENNKVFAVGFTKDDDGIESVAIVDVRQDVVTRHYRGPFITDLNTSVVFIKPSELRFCGEISYFWNLNSGELNYSDKSSHVCQVEYSKDIISQKSRNMTVL